MASQTTKGILSKSIAEKIPLLNTVSRKIIDMANELPGLDVLDFTISKTDQRITLSIGYKKEKPHQTKFDLSDLFVESPRARTNIMPTCQESQPHQGLVQVHDRDCPCSTNKDTLYNDELQVKMPMSERPEFSDRQKSHHVCNSPGIKRMENEIVKVLIGNCDTAPHTPGRDSDSSEDGQEDVPSWFSEFLNKDMDKLDSDYFQHLLDQKEKYPDNPATHKRLNTFAQRHFKNTEDYGANNYREFIPGQPWMSKEQKDHEELIRILDEVETSISVLNHKTAALHIGYDLIDQAVARGNDRNLAQNIREAIDDHDKKNSKKYRNFSPVVQDVRMNDFNTGFGPAIRKKFHDMQMNRRTQKQKEDMKERYSKTEDDVQKHEDLNCHGPYGSTLFM